MYLMYFTYVVHLMKNLNLCLEATDLDRFSCHVSMGSAVDP